MRQYLFVYPDFLTKAIVSTVDAQSLFTSIVISVRTLGSRRANLQLRAGAIIRDELSQPRCRSLPLKGTRGKIKTRSLGSCRISAFRAYRQVLETVFQRIPWRGRGRQKTLKPIVVDRQASRHEGIILFPSFISAKSVCCYDTSPFAISRAIVVALFIAAAGSKRAARSSS